MAKRYIPRKELRLVDGKEIEVSVYPPSRKRAGLSLTSLRPRMLKRTGQKDPPVRLRSDAPPPKRRERKVRCEHFPDWDTLSGEEPRIVLCRRCGTEAEVSDQGVGLRWSDERPGGS